MSYSGSAFTVSGRKRLVDGSPCEDAAGWAISRDGTSAVLAVADGVGSAARSDVGARIAVDLFIDQARSSAPCSVPEIRDLVVSVRERWMQELRPSSEQSRLTDFNTTFICATTTRWGVLVATIGDCFSVLMRQSAVGPRYFLSTVQDRPRRDGGMNLTHTWLSDNWLDHLHCVEFVDPSICGVLLASDGLEDVAIRSAWHEGEQAELRPVGVQLGVVDQFLEGTRRGYVSSGSELAEAVRSTDLIMDAKGDDIGVALSVW